MIVRIYKSKIKMQKPVPDRLRNQNDTTHFVGAPNVKTSFAFFPFLIFTLSFCIFIFDIL